MTERECMHEDDVIEAIASGRWNHASDDLQLHVAGCSTCHDLAVVAAAVLDDSAAAREVAVPSSGLVWWRAKRRAKEEAARSAARAMTAVQAVSVLGGAVAAVVIISAMSVSVPEWSRWLRELTRFETATGSLPLILAMTACLTLLPFVFYFSLSEE